MVAWTCDEALLHGWKKYAVRPLTPPAPGDLLQLLRAGQPRTKAELAALTGLARSTISSRVDTLLATGLVAPAGDGVSSGGRPPARLAFNPSARIVIAVDLGATHGTVAISDLDGKILLSRNAEITIAGGPRPVLSWVVETALELIQEIGRDLRDVVGVGIGVPGPVEHSTGRPITPPRSCLDGTVSTSPLSFISICPFPYW